MKNFQRSNRISFFAFTATILFFIAALLSEFIPRSYGEGWHSFEEAQQIAKLSGKKIFVDAYADWCLPCKEMEKTVFTDLAVQSLFDSLYIKAKVNIDDAQGKAFQASYRIQGVPTCLIVDSDGNEWSRSVGFVHPYIFTKWLKDDQYKILEKFKPYESAKVAAQEERKNILVLFAENGSTTEQLGKLCSVDSIKQLIQSHFIASFIMSTHERSRTVMKELKITTGEATDFLGLLVIVNPQGKELGRIPIVKLAPSQPAAIVEFLLAHRNIAS